MISSLGKSAALVADTKQLAEQLASSRRDLLAAAELARRELEERLFASEPGSEAEAGFADAVALVEDAIESLEAEDR